MFIAVATLTLLSVVSSALSLQSAQPTQAQAKPSQGQARPGTETIVLQSSSKDDYVLYVALPQGYGTSEARYPVVYLLDGDWYFDMTVGVQRLLTATQSLRPAIIVGIGYGGDDVAKHRERRFREMTPTPIAQRPGSGKADTFLTTLRDDVIPLIERRFRTNGDRVLVGHSLGGLLVSVALVRQPSMFHGYGILSPSLWWDDGVVFREEEKLRKRGAVVRGRAYLAIGDKEVPMVDPLRKLAGVLAEPGYPDLKVAHQVFADATHTGVVPAAISAALQALIGAPPAPPPPPPR